MIPPTLENAHNQRLKELVRLVSDKVEQAQSQADLLDAISEVKKFDGPLRYNNTIFNTIAALAFLLAAASWAAWGYFGKGVLVPTVIDPPIVVGLIAFTFGTVGLIAFTSGTMRNAAISKLSNRIFEKGILFDNNLNEIPFDKRGKARELEQKFHEFDRGNHSREIWNLCEGFFVGETYQFGYHLYSFHYVDRHTETVSDGKGGTRTRVRYDHHNRYGIYMPFEHAANIAVLSFDVEGIRGASFRPASNRFNEIYRVIALDEFEAAKFLKPAVVLAFEAIADCFTDLNFEINANAELCMSFGDNILPLGAVKRKYGLENPDPFIAEILAHQTMSKLNLALDHVHTLLQYSDNNFKEK